MGQTVSVLTLRTNGRRITKSRLVCGALCHLSNARRIGAALGIHANRHTPMSPLFAIEPSSHQIRALFSGARKSLSPAVTLNASYQASMFRTTPLTPQFARAFGLSPLS